MKQILIGAAAVVAILAGAVMFGKDDTEIVKEPSNNFYGLEQADVTLVEYGDFSCPACAAFHPLVDQIKEEYADQIRFEFRHFPLLQNLGPHRATQAAANQGKFWEMHDLIFERQQSWRSLSQQTAAGHGGSGSIPDTSAQIATFQGYAEEIGLDIEQYNTDFALAETIGTVNADAERAREDNATATPTFLLNGEKIQDSSQVDTVEKFRALIDAELEKVSSDTDTDTEQSSSDDAATTPEQDSETDQ